MLTTPSPPHSSLLLLLLRGDTRSKKKKAGGGGNAVVELTENNFEDMVLKSDEVRCGTAVVISYTYVCVVLTACHCNLDGMVDCPHYIALSLHTPVHSEKLPGLFRGP